MFCVLMKCSSVPGWSCETTKQLSGVTQTCSAWRTGVANFSYLFELQLSFNLEVLQSETGW